MKKLALVLGGGAARGYAHVGVLKVLEKNGITPDLIVGTSMGALVGGLYSIGKTADELEKLAQKFNSIGTFSLISTLFKDNILNVSKAKKMIHDQVKELTHEDCKIPFVSIATELNTGKEKRFTKGLLKETIMASISIPGVFPRQKIGENFYCDGGLLNNLPENVAKELMPDAIVLSIDVIGDYASQVEKLKFKTIETFLNASTLMTTNVIKNRPQDADLRITISMPHVSQMDFTKPTALKTIKKGENFARKYLPQIKQLLQMEK